MLNAVEADYNIIWGMIHYGNDVPAALTST